MFDIGWSELLLIGIAAIIVIGPKDLPRAMRQAGRWMATVRRLAGDFQSQVNEAMRETELDELRREARSLKEGARSLKEEAQAALDPVRNASRDMQAAIEAEPAPKALPAPGAKPRPGKAKAPTKNKAPTKKRTPAKPRAKKTGDKA